MFDPIALGPTVDAVLRASEFTLCQSQHPKNFQGFSVSTVCDIYLRFCRMRFVHCRNDSKNAHSRDIKGISNFFNISINIYIILLLFYPGRVTVLERPLVSI